jgi:hypothetical protein
MSTEFFCKYCQIACNGKAPFEQHLQSAKHMKKAKENPLTEPPASPKSVLHSTSSASNTTTSEDPSVSSASYTISRETMRILLEWDHPDGYKPYCDICQLQLQGGDGENAEAHFNPSNNIHNQKLAAWKTIREGDGRFSCKVCSEIFSTENIMREHFISDAHGDMVQRKVNLNKFIQIYQTYEKLKQARLQRKDDPIIPPEVQSNSTECDNLSNQFDKLKVIDLSEENSKSKKFPIISSDKFVEVMSKRFANDDDE